MAILPLNDGDARNDPPRPLMEHLLALRDMLIFGAVSWALCVVIALVFSNHIFGWLQEPLTSYLDSHKVALAARGPLDGISSGLQVGFWAGTALSFPLLMFALLRFVFPALTKREKAVLLSILFIGSVFFIVGVWLAYRETLPVMMETFAAINRWMGIQSEQYFVPDYVPVVLKTLFAFGLVFQLPLIIFVLGWFGLISSDGLRQKRRIAIVVAFVLSMLLTPPDPMSQVIMAVPLCLLYEVALWAVWLKERTLGK